MAKSLMPNDGIRDVLRMEGKGRERLVVIKSIAYFTRSNQLPR
jgi:hypothetical protein